MDIVAFYQDTAGGKNPNAIWEKFNNAKIANKALPPIAPSSPKPVDKLFENPVSIKYFRFLIVLHKLTIWRTIIWAGLSYKDEIYLYFVFELENCTRPTRNKKETTSECSHKTTDPINGNLLKKKTY